MHAFMGAVRTLANNCLDIIYPPLCGLCRTHSVDPSSGWICAGCHDLIPRLVEPFCPRCAQPYPGRQSSNKLSECSHCHDLRLSFDSAQAPFLASPESLHLVHLLKYHGKSWVAQSLARGMYDSCLHGCRPGSGWDLIVSVPLHPLKLRERGFNQAGILADHLARMTGLTHSHMAVCRVRPTLSQTGFGRRERFVNMRKAFGPGRESGVVGGGNILLVDDVLTTGATLNDCARVLKLAGARTVGVLTAVRGFS